MLERLRARLIGSVLVWDLIATLLCLVLVIGVTSEPPLHQWPLYGGVAFIWTLVFIILAPQRAIFTRTLLEAITRLFLAVLLAATSFAGWLYLINGNLLDRGSFLRFVALNLGVLSAIHLGFRTLTHWQQARGGGRHVLVVGDAHAAARLADEFRRRPWTGVQIVGYVSDERDTPTTLSWLGSVSDLVRLVRQHHIDEVIFALPPSRHTQVVELSLQLISEPVMLHMVPTALDLAFARTPVDNVGGIPLVSLRESALTPTQRLTKRLFDIVVSLILLVLLSPIMALIALLIKLESPGPVIFKQERIGEHGRRFQMFKFRSMYIDADRRWHEVAKRDETTGKLLHKQKDDPRVTRVGRKLRRTSLDELPQLFNVLRGEMSLVGPRPEMPYIAAEYEPWQWQRFRVPPGITGWWQVNGRSEKPMHLHTEDDLYYIQNYSFWLDLRILAKTLIVVWQGHGAY
ncbi:sugar transferase [uncultured Chloroflexus sp.]|uniref:sugar transferase n=1 Tax=uncultured Chloroflexus sp. TaxID=214040 RepID=UPI002609ED77|nr:sugar transferase [uncultured Chloroflexus sp.]